MIDRFQPGDKVNFFQGKYREHDFGVVIGRDACAILEERSANRIAWFNYRENEEPKKIKETNVHPDDLDLLENIARLEALNIFAVTDFEALNRKADPVTILRKAIHTVASEDTFSGEGAVLATLRNAEEHVTSGKITCLRGHAHYEGLKAE